MNIKTQKQLSTLQRKFNYGPDSVVGGIATRQEFIEASLSHKGHLLSVGKSPKKIFNRHHYNRMTDWREQEKYEKDCNTFVEKVRIQNIQDGCFWELTKTGSEYAKVVIICNLLRNLGDRMEENPTTYNKVSVTLNVEELSDLLQCVKDNDPNNLGIPAWTLDGMSTFLHLGSETWDGYTNGNDLFVIKNGEHFKIKCKQDFIISPAGKSNGDFIAEYPLTSKSNIHFEFNGVLKSNGKDYKSEFYVRFLSDYIKVEFDVRGLGLIKKDVWESVINQKLDYSNLPTLSTLSQNSRRDQACLIAAGILDAAGYTLTLNEKNSPMCDKPNELGEAQIFIDGLHTEDAKSADEIANELATAGTKTGLGLKFNRPEFGRTIKRGGGADNLFTSSQMSLF